MCQKDMHPRAIQSFPPLEARVLEGIIDMANRDIPIWGVLRTITHHYHNDDTQMHTPLGLLFFDELYGVQ
jgi:hypothetical protein